MKQITLNTFKSDVLDCQKPVVLEFYGSFCSACSMMEPLLEKAEALYGDKITFTAVNADQEEMLNTFLNVHTLPALFFIKDGRTLLHHEGFMPWNQLEQTVSSLLSL